MSRIKSQKQLRAEFWRAHPDLSRRRIGADYPTDTRVAFVDFIDGLARAGDISDKLAQRTTLE